MNYKSLLKGAFGVLAGSFVVGGIRKIVKRMAIDATWRQLEEIYGEEQVKRFREIQHISCENEEPSE